MVETDRLQMSIQYGPCAMHAEKTNARGTHGECVVFIAFSRN